MYTCHSGEGAAERSVPWHTNRYDRNKIKGVGLRQNMYGPLNRELIKAKAARRFIRACLITHWQSHYLNSGDSSLKCLLEQGTPRWSGQTNGFTTFSRGKCQNPGPSIPIWGYYEAASEALLGEEGLKNLTGRKGGEIFTRATSVLRGSQHLHSHMQTFQATTHGTTLTLDREKIPNSTGTNGFSLFFQPQHGCYPPPPNGVKTAGWWGRVYAERHFHSSLSNEIILRFLAVLALWGENFGNKSW